MGGDSAVQIDMARRHLDFEQARPRAVFEVNGRAAPILLLAGEVLDRERARAEAPIGQRHFVFMKAAADAAVRQIAQAAQKGHRAFADLRRQAAGRGAIFEDAVDVQAVVEPVAHQALAAPQLDVDLVAHPLDRPRRF
jgi:hypothetical protein